MVGLVLLLTAAAETARSAPPATPSAFPPGITFESLAETPPGPLGLQGPQGPGSSFAVLARITYAPGAAFDFHAPGPILYYVEQGALMIQLNKGHTALVIPGRGSNGHSSFTFHGNQPITLPAGDGIYADDGYVGATRNARQTPVVVLVTYLFSQVPTNGVHHHQSIRVTPAPTSTPRP